MVGLGTEDADWLGSCMKVYLVQNYWTLLKSQREMF